MKRLLKRIFPSTGSGRLILVVGGLIVALNLVANFDRRTYRNNLEKFFDTSLGDILSGVVAIAVPLVAVLILLGLFSYGLIGLEKLVSIPANYLKRRKYRRKLTERYGEQSGSGRHESDSPNT